MYRVGNKWLGNIHPVNTLYTIGLSFWYDAVDWILALISGIGGDDKQSGGDAGRIILSEIKGNPNDYYTRKGFDFIDGPDGPIYGPIYDDEHIIKASEVIETSQYFDFAPLSGDFLNSAGLDIYGVRNLFIASDQQYDINTDGPFPSNALDNVRSFVQGGGTLITTGKSSIFPAMQAGSQSPKFGFYSGFPRPRQTSSVTSVVDIKNAEIKEFLGGLDSVTLTSALPKSSHSIVIHPGSSRVLSTATYIMEDMIISPWGAELEIYALTAPSALDYSAGSNGGKVIYSNIELSPNYGNEDLPQMYVDALLDPVLFKEHDEEEISDRVDSDDPESNPIINFRALNLNMVVYNGGIKINNTKVDSDVTFSFIVSSRRTK